MVTSEHGEGGVRGHGRGHGVQGHGIDLSPSESYGFDISNIASDESKQVRKQLDSNEEAESEIFESFSKADKKDVKAMRIQTDKVFEKLSHLEKQRHEVDMSTTRVMESMVWVDECENERACVNVQARKLPRHLTSSRADSDRVPSEADSIEGMIDDMVGDEINADKTLPGLRCSVLESGRSLTPLSPFPEELYKKGSADYRLAYISDDNLEEDNDVFERDDAATDSENPKSSVKKRPLQAMGSLDKLLNEQGDLIDTDEKVDVEYQTALRYSEGDNEILDSDLQPELISNKTYEDSYKQKLVASKQSQSTENAKYADKSEGKILPKAKPKLETKNSLDALLDKQGSVIDIDMENADIDDELLKTLQRDFDECMQQNTQSNPKHSECTYLGVRHSLDGKQKPYMAAEDDTSEDEFENIVGNAESFIKKDTISKTEKEQIKVIISKMGIPIQEASSSDSSDSDTLSVIEEVEDETSEKENIGDNKEKSNYCLPDVNKVLEVVKPKVRDDSEEEKVQQYMKGPPKPPRAKGTLYEKVKNIESLTASSDVSTLSPVKKKSLGKKSQGKYKKLQDHWQAVEKHEADILDLEEDSEGRVEQIQENLKPVDVQDMFNPVIVIDKVDNASMNESNVYCESISDTSSFTSPDVGADYEFFPSHSRIEVVKKEHHSLDESHPICESISDRSDMGSLSFSSNKTFDTLDHSSDERRLKISINDSNPLCQSISEVDDSITIPVDEGLNAYDTSRIDNYQKVERHGIRLRGNCHSIPDLEDLTKESHAPVGECKSIDDLDVILVPPEGFGGQEINVDEMMGRHQKVVYCRSLSDGESELSYHVHEKAALCHSIDEKMEHEVSTLEHASAIVTDPSDIDIHSDNAHPPLKRLCVTNVDHSPTLTSEALFKTQVNMLVDSHGNVSPPIRKEEELFFKVPPPPIRPPRTKKVDPPSSACSSPEVFNSSPEDKLDSPRSGIIYHQ